LETLKKRDQGWTVLSELIASREITQRARKLNALGVRRNRVTIYPLERKERPRKRGEGGLEDREKPNKERRI